MKPTEMKPASDGKELKLAFAAVPILVIAAGVAAAWLLSDEQTRKTIENGIKGLMGQKTGVDLGHGKR